MVQGEIIKSLKMAAQFEHAVLSLTLLHEASITNKRDALVTLDQLKQRLLMRLPATHQFEDAPYAYSDYRSVATPQSGKLSDNFIPAAVTIPSKDGTKDSKHGLASYFRKKRNHDPSKASQMNNPPDINFSPALEQLARAKGDKDRAIIMRDIDHIIDSYNGLNVTQNSESPQASQALGGSLQRQDTLAMLHGVGPSSRDHPMPTSMHLFSQPSQIPDGYNAGSTSNHHAFSSQPSYQNQQQQTYTQPQYSQTSNLQSQTQSRRSRLSAASVSSSAPSDTPSIQRNGSFSSQESQAHPFPLPLIRPSPTLSPITPQSPSSPSAPYQYNDGNLSPPSPYAASEGTYYSQYSQPLSPQRSRGSSNATQNLPQQPSYQYNTTYPPRVDSHTYQNSPYATSPTHDQPHFIPPFPEPPKQLITLHDQKSAENQFNRPKYHLMPLTSREAQPIQDAKSERPVTNSLMPPTSPIDNLRVSSTAPSIVSTDSANSANIGVLPGSLSKIIRSGTVQSGGSEKMMDGRPCKSNNYWGFCKGAWTTREDIKKGLHLRTQPSGMYNTKEIWGCAECTFKGPSFSSPHPTKKNKTIAVIDPRIATSSSGIRYVSLPIPTSTSTVLTPSNRYRWIFLAKSHTKRSHKDSSHSHPTPTSLNSTSADDYAYGCIFCCAEDKVTSVYGGVETLMNHIAAVHVASMTEKTRRKANCVIGRVASAEEEWDVNVPVFGVVEMEG